jgi:hypothetical protein
MKSAKHFGGGDFAALVDLLPRYYGHFRSESLIRPLQLVLYSPTPADDADHEHGVIAGSIDGVAARIEITDSRAVCEEISLVKLCKISGGHKYGFCASGYRYNPRNCFRCEDFCCAKRE